MDLLNSNLLVTNLVECLEDTYESNQQRALNLLHSIPKVTLEKSLPNSQLSGILQKAFQYLYSSRTQDSMSAAYLFLSTFVDAQRSMIVLSQFTMECNDLNVKFEGLSLDAAIGNVTEELSITLIQAVLRVIRHQIYQAQVDLVLASQKCPLYPALMCLRYLLRKAEMTDASRWKAIMQQVFDVTHDDMHPLVAPVVCHSSPEGYLPPEEDVETEGSRRPALPQYLIVCCWRTVKEISLVYGTIMERVAPTQPHIISKSQICEYIKSFYEYILLKAKHRGAFEMAYTGYCSYWCTVWRLNCCQGLVSAFLTDSPYSMLLTQSSADNLCATRRSAGLPFMVQAYVTTEPKLHNNSALKVILNTLLPMSVGVPAAHLTDPADGVSGHSQVQRVHALNVLRTLYRCSSLGDAVLPFVSQGLKSAITGYKSQIWPVRNAATLLFSALITRMFGVKQGKDDLSKQSGMAGRLFFQRYPEIHPFLLQEFEASTEFRSADGQTLLQPSLYLLLLVLCKLYPSQKESADINLSLDVFVPYLHLCAASPVYKARMLAALALANILNHDAITETLTYLCGSVSDCRQHNRLHGLLLQIYHLYVSIADGKSSSAIEVISAMLNSNTHAILSSPCDMVRASYIDIIRIAKPHIQTKYPDSIAVVLNAALGAALPTPADVAVTTHHLDKPWETNKSHDWLRESVDLQLSRCHLLLDTNHPVVCTRESLLWLLSETSMYELHHIILSAPLLADRKLLSIADLLAVLTQMVQLNNTRLSYNTTRSIDLLADRLSESCLSSAVNTSVVSGLQDVVDSIGWQQSSLSLLKLRACLFSLESQSTQRYSISQILDPLLDYMRGDDVEPHGSSVCVEILRLLTCSRVQRVKAGETTLNELPQNYWIAWVLLIFNVNIDISGQACAAVGAVLTAQGHSLTSDSDPHSNISHLLRCMSSVYDKQTVEEVWKSWLSSDCIWLPDSVVPDTEDDKERLFSKAEGKLLCDPQSFNAILQQHLRML